MTVSISTLKTENAARWSNCEVHTSKLLVSVATRLVGSKPRYAIVENATKVPWAIVAVIHEREASGSWLGNLANGDPWNKETIHVPRGRGPFPSWEAAAEDALINCPPKAASNIDWTIGGALTLLEQYNGLGYAAMGRPSPYVWASTNQYLSGKYVADGLYDPNVVDTQLGCAALLKQMQLIDNTVQV